MPTSLPSSSLSLSVFRCIRPVHLRGVWRRLGQERGRFGLRCAGRVPPVDRRQVHRIRCRSLVPATLATLAHHPHPLSPPLPPRSTTSKPAPTASTSTSAPTPAAAPATPEQKAQAEKAKSKGNQLMAAKDYDGAIKSYGDAIELDGQNAVYWSNR